MASYSLLIEQVLTEVDLILKSYVYDGYQALTNYLEVPLGLLIVLFYVVYGISLTHGWTKGSVSGFVKSVFKVGLIYYFGMNWGHFSDYVVSLFYEGAGHIGDVLVTASPVPLPDVDGAGINAALQTVFTELLEIGQWLIDKGSFSNWGPFFGGVGVYVSAGLLVGFALLEIVIAKIMLSILFVTAPLFIAFTMFKPTHTFFDRWLGACVGYSLLMIFICAGLGVVIALDYWAIADVYLSKADGIRFLEVCVVVVMTLICFGILKRIALLAVSIGGTVTTLSSNEMVAGAVGGVMGGIASMNAGVAGLRMMGKLAKGYFGADFKHSAKKSGSDSSMTDSVMSNLKSGGGESALKNE
jgi:type IV secretion system protein VirB6